MNEKIAGPLNYLIRASEIIVWSQEEHAMALLPA